MKKYLRAMAVWLLMTPLGILNGGLRIYVTEPLLGSIALPLSSIILSVMIIVFGYLLIPKIGKCTPKEYLIIGFCWAILTNIFDLTVTMIEKRPISDFIEMYNVTTGNLWILVVIMTLITPSIVGNIKKKNISKVLGGK